MKPLPERKSSLWGTEYDVIPYLIDAIHGDGKQWLWFGYLDDRPSYYVVRVDSSVIANNDNDQWADEVLEWIYEAIDEEMREFMTDEQHDEWQEKGYLEGDRQWPIPPLECPCGSEWGEYEPSADDLKAA
jgi:asparagine synthetase B (glutamine-hydrolysing)